MTILCSDQEAEVLLYALDSLSTSLVKDDKVHPALAGFADLYIEQASDLAQRIEEQLRPDGPTIAAERALLTQKFNGFITVISKPE